ncbi:MAG: sodium:solute symporter family transporter [Eisenbergiella sp.]
MVYVIILLLYLAALIFVGKLASRGVSSSDDWAVAGRSLGVWSSAASYFTTVLSAVSFIGYMGYYYQFGWGGWELGRNLNLYDTVCRIFAARLRRFGGVTISDFLDRRFERPMGDSRSSNFIFTVLFTMAQLVASAPIIKVITGIRSICPIIVGIVFLAFTVTGG